MADAMAMTGLTEQYWQESLVGLKLFESDRVKDWNETAEAARQRFSKCERDWRTKN